MIRAKKGDGLDIHGLVKPLLRGRLHVGAVVVAVPAAIILVLSATSARAAWSGAVYGTTLVALFGVSGAYHRLGHTMGRRAVLRRADHATIYTLIAGSYTPVAVVAIGGHLGWSIVISVWIVAAVGMALKLIWFDRTQLAGWVLYIALGWVVVGAIPALIVHLDDTELALIIAGGLAYTAGTLVLGRRRPDPYPRVFGYHEVWHSIVILAAALHYAAIYLIVSGP